MLGPGAAVANLFACSLARPAAWAGPGVAGGRAGERRKQVSPTADERRGCNPLFFPPARIDFKAPPEHTCSSAGPLRASLVRICFCARTRAFCFAQKTIAWDWAEKKEKSANYCLISVHWPAATWPTRSQRSKLELLDWQINYKQRQKLAETGEREKVEHY